MGFALPMIFSKINNWRSTAEFLVGFSFMLLGLSFMKDAVPDLSQDAEILSFLRFYKVTIWTTVLAVFMGGILTVIVQSSSVSIGMVQVLAAQGFIPIEFAVAMVLGSNIGTTVTTNIASLIASRDAKRAARIHSLINVIGAIWAIFVMNYLLLEVDWFCSNVLELPYSVFSENPVERGEIMPFALATFHTGFNLLNALLLVWFIPFLVKISDYLVGKQESIFEVTKMDKNFIIEIPELEVLEVKNDLLRLTKMSKEIFDKVHNAFLHQKIEQQFLDEINEEFLDVKSFETTLVNYLSKVYQEHPSAETSEVLIDMTRITSDLKEVGLSSNLIANLVYQKIENRLLIDEQVYRGLGKIFEYLIESFGRILKDINRNTSVNIEKYIVLEEKINQQKSHLRMLQLSKEVNIDLENELLVADLTNALSLVGNQLFSISSILMNKKGTNW
jgi:phosphate:Na+ symporter